MDPARRLRLFASARPFGAFAQELPACCVKLPLGLLSQKVLTRIHLQVVDIAAEIDGEEH